MCEGVALKDYKVKCGKCGVFFQPKNSFRSYCYDCVPYKGRRG